MTLSQAINTANSNTAAIQAEYANLKADLERNNEECSTMKTALESLISATLRTADISTIPTDNDDGFSVISDSNSSVFDVLGSLESLDHISITDDDMSSIASSNSVDLSMCRSVDVSSVKSSNPSNVNIDDIPGLNMLLHCVEEGKVVLSEEISGQLLEMSSKMTAISEVSTVLQERWSLIDDKLITHKKELEDLKNEHHELKQYIKQDNLLLHGFPLPPYKLSSLHFSHFIAEQINYFLPMLDFPVRWEHISDAHPLRTYNKHSNVIIIRFCNRNMRHEVYANREFLPKGLSITEHLTPTTRDIASRACELFGKDAVYTDRCKVFVTLNGRARYMKSMMDVNEAFESTILYPSSNSVQHPPKHSGAFNSNYQQNYSTNSRKRRPYNKRNKQQRWQGSGGKHRHPSNRKRSNYSVYNREYFQQDLSVPESVDPYGHFGSGHGRGFIASQSHNFT